MSIAETKAKILSYAGGGLQPCPFCGGISQINTLPAIFVECRVCEARGPWFRDTLDSNDAIDKAVADWNNRREPTP